MKAAPYRARGIYSLPWGRRAKNVDSLKAGSKVRAGHLTLKNLHGVTPGPGVREYGTAAGFSPPPSTLTTGTLTHCPTTQTFTSSSEVVTAYGGYAVTSIRTMRSPIDRSTAKESSFERALTGTNPTFDLQRKTRPSEQAFVSVLKRRHVGWAMRARQRAHRSYFSLLVIVGTDLRPSKSEKMIVSATCWCTVRASMRWQRAPVDGLEQNLTTQVFW